VPEASSVGTLQSSAVTEASPVAEFSTLSLAEMGCDAPRVRNDHVEVCFKRAGDKFYVLDGKRDGRSAYADFQVRGDPDGSGPGFDTSGTCRNSLGAGHWGVCDYEIEENPNIVDVVYNGFTKDNGAWPNPVRNQLPPRWEVNNRAP
jgi:hypothetical protein